MKITNMIAKFLAVIVVLVFSLLFFPQDLRAVEKIVLNNGLTIIYKKNISTKMAICDLFIRGGNFNEKKGQYGITNLMHKVLLKGTKTLTKDSISKQTEFLGSSLNTDIFNDFSEVWFVCPKESFNSLFDILVDVIKNPIFDKDEIENEKNLACASIRAQKDNIFSFSHQSFNKLMYGEFPYSRLIAGDESSVIKITRNDIQEYYTNYFTANNYIFVISGDIDFKEIIKKIEKDFGDLLPNGMLKQDMTGDLMFNDTVVIKQQSVFKQAYLMFGFMAPEVASVDYAKMKLINTLVGEGENSKIFSNLREKYGFSYELGSFYPSRKYVSQLVIYAGLNKVNIEKARYVITEEIKQFSEYITERELINAKSYLIGRFVLDHQSLKKQAWYLGFFEVLGRGLEYDSVYPYEIAGILPDDIRRTAKKYLKETNWKCLEISQ